MKLDDRVAAQITLSLARSLVLVAELEAREKEVPALSGTSSSRLRLARKLTSARALRDSWQLVADLVQEEAAEDDMAVALEKEFPKPDQAAPELTVAWRGTAPGVGRVLVCNRSSNCRGSYRSTPFIWTPLTSSDLPDGGICTGCETDVLA